MLADQRSTRGGDTGSSTPRTGSSAPLAWFGSLSLAGRCLAVCGVLVVFICALFAEENWRGRRAWEICRRELQAKGALDWQKFVPATVPPEQNFAMTPFLAPLFDFNPKPRQPGQSAWRDQDGHDRAANFATAPMPTNDKGELPSVRFEGRMTDLEKALSLMRNQSNRPPVSTGPFSSRAEAAAAVLAAQQEYEPVLAELRSASLRPYSRFDIEYDAEDPISILLPHYIVLVRVAGVLEVRASAELALGNSGSAFEDVAFIHRVANSIKDEPFMIGGLTRGSMMKRSEQIIWEGLADRSWSEAQLRQFQGWLQAFTPLKDLEKALQAERAAFGDATFRYLRGHKNVLRMWLGSDEARPLLYLLAGPDGWMYQEQVSYHRLYDQFVLAKFDPDSGHLQPKVIDQNGKALERDLKRSVFWHHTGFSRLIFVNLMKSFQRAAVGQDRANQTIAACALERYRLANGRYPDALPALVPQFVEKLPLDVCDGKPLKYRLLPDGQFLLYGVGWNEKDDGGQLVKKPDGADFDPNQGDWVWPRYAEK